MNVRDVIFPINRLGVKFKWTIYLVIDVLSFQPHSLSIHIVKSAKIIMAKSNEKIKTEKVKIQKLKLFFESLRWIHTFP